MNPYSVVARGGSRPSSVVERIAMTSFMGSRPQRVSRKSATVMYQACRWAPHPVGRNGSTN